MLNGNRILLILDNTKILSMLLLVFELICSRARCFLGLEGKALHFRAKDRLLSQLGLAHLGVGIFTVEKRTLLAIDAHYFIYLQLIIAKPCYAKWVE